MPVSAKSWASGPDWGTKHTSVSSARLMNSADKPVGHREPMLKKLARRVLPTGIWSQMQRLRLWWQLRTYRPRQVCHRYGDTLLTVELTDPLAEGWYDHDWESLPEIMLLRQHRLRPGARCFDLGAH